MLTVTGALVAAMLMTSCRGQSEPVIVLTYTDGNTSQRIMSDGEHLVSSYHVEDRLIDCDARLGNLSQSKYIFKEALTNRADSQMLVDYDIKRLARQCKRFLRKMLHSSADDPDSVVRHIKERHKLQLGFPGAPWCSLPSRGALGTPAKLRQVDKCCQALYDCPDSIGEYEMGWNLFNRWNYRLFHCRCAEQFRDCLKKLRRGSANEVGRLYFDVVQPKCIRLEDRRVCKKWDAWFTTCLQDGMEDQALLLPSPKYTE